MELIKDYDCIIDYYLGKANVVVDALNRKNKVGIGGLWGEKHEGLTKLGKMRAQLCLRVDGSLLAKLVMQLVIWEKIREHKKKMLEWNNEENIIGPEFAISNIKKWSCSIGNESLFT